jgi:hypothetical protein
MFIPKWRMRGRPAAGALCACMLVAACARAGSDPGYPPAPPGAGTPRPPAGGQTPMVPASLQAMVRLALDDAARRSGRDAATLEVKLATQVTWPDGSIGCPQPDRMYTQALVPGYRIVIAAGSELLEYHGAGQGAPGYCPPERLRAPAAGSSRT